MQCEVHADRTATHSVGGAAACDGCVEAAKERTRLFGASLPLLASIAYLLALAIGYFALKGRPIVGGLAAVAALFVGRGLQILVFRPVRPLSSLPRGRVDAPPGEQ